MDDPLVLFCWLACTYFVGTFVTAFLEAVSEAKEEAHQELLKELDDKVHRVEMEARGNIVYWFDQDSGRFLAQGATSEEIINHIKSRFPDHLFYVQLLEKGHIIGQRTDWLPTPVENFKL
jgi:hypothetical protein